MAGEVGGKAGEFTAVESKRRKHVRKESVGGAAEGSWKDDQKNVLDTALERSVLTLTTFVKGLPTKEPKRKPSVFPSLKDSREESHFLPRELVHNTRLSFQSLCVRVRPCSFAPP